ncbi:MAG: DNA repair protein RecO [Chloroflexota bacterium]|nr:DNA repair protein RecO [Chloroflexota bacterium]
MPRGTGQRTYRTEGIVLRGRDLREADRILTIITPDRGKVRAVAKGVRKMTSKKSGHLESFCRCAMLLAQGHDLDVIAQVEMIEPFSRLRADLDLLGPAYYLAELVDTFSEEESGSRALYDAFVAALVALDVGADAAATCRWFELFILTLNGLAPSWSTCAGCNTPIAPDLAYVYSVERGGLLCPACRQLDVLAPPIETATIKALRLLARESLARIVQVRLPPDALDEAGTVLGRWIRAATERDLRSPLVLQRMDDGYRVERERRDGVR